MVVPDERGSFSMQTEVDNYTIIPPYVPDTFYKPFHEEID